MRRRRYNGRMNNYSYERLIAMQRRETIPCCETVHTDHPLHEMQAQMPNEEVLYDLAELFKIFGDSTRIRILYALFEKELCVCDIARLLDMTQSAISHQLRILKQSKLVKYRREGKAMFYSLSDNHVRAIINQGLQHVEE